LAKFRHEFVARAGIDLVWDFFTDPTHFETISPVDLNERLIRTSNPKLVQGTEVWISTSLFMARVWHATITKSTPYEYVDSVKGSFFKCWTHTHRFVPIENGATRVIDEIIFECRYGPIGKIFEAVIASKLPDIFRFREAKTKEILEKPAS
jgi:ligand-binding SRPBCC domain-containing protein